MREGVRERRRKVKRWTVTLELKKRIHNVLWKKFSVEEEEERKKR